MNAKKTTIKKDCERKDTTGNSCNENADNPVGHHHINNNNGNNKNKNVNINTNTNTIKFVNKKYLDKKTN